ncbi:MAG: vitamin B12-binding protein [Lactobacillus ruminis]|nr:vitamin B12-binding protein [Ligilactobacillus ruminis]
MVSDYGQISRIGVLPVTEGRYLRSNLNNRRFARNGGPVFTGRFQKLAFCP